MTPSRHSSQSVPGDDIPRPHSPSDRRRLVSARGIRSLQAMAIRQAAIVLESRLSGQIWHQTRDEEAGRQERQRRNAGNSETRRFGLHRSRARLFFNSCTDVTSLSLSATSDYHHALVLPPSWHTSANTPTKAHLLPPGSAARRRPWPTAGTDSRSKREYTTLVHGPSLAKLRIRFPARRQAERLWTECVRFRTKSNGSQQNRRIESGFQARA